jgi:hypothetical protein
MLIAQQPSVRHTLFHFFENIVSRGKYHGCSARVTIHKQKFQKKILRARDFRGRIVSRGKYHGCSARVKIHKKKSKKMKKNPCA